MIISIIIFSILSFILGVIVSLVSCFCKVKSNLSLINDIDELLPQMQCAQCGYPGCYAYSQAIVDGNENIYKCIPGGKEVVLKLENLLNKSDHRGNFLESLEDSVTYSIVEIDENNCVGCSKCRLVCPVDAVVGTYNFRHTVLIDSCTGCNLCIPLCPTNCIKKKIMFYE
ncbi:electron transport complex protein RnfB [Buchnera aphidicola str. Bp (Baizongia pistaciae)]|uniref:Ion-translocating oxidoreductase complex subunit B n=1 Tax=Buchnera aphidicola subsp. Baizongia pistaciae (strain Bp) TaxID=224915 RepID=RNFB_BUCBP|nr:RnfABCDGE type electron transport complex subunit B [Buchnera aphidicola]Q89AW9.1 RecName: Full=Ion-translocating oxidoreductase complex subunit B; AltName: Full=Rnf electron transport complex subunit B [Buchnera aphidicola str. Bp (Baizongia pistaciae)]AAO26843.1 electron transport complex protein RnfB [Buchnera aphidicola str. Bp (Baizongia pistaciae)]